MKIKRSLTSKSINIYDPVHIFVASCPDTASFEVLRNGSVMRWDGAAHGAALGGKMPNRHLYAIKLFVSKEELE